MFITVETKYRDRVENACTSDKTGEPIIFKGFLRTLAVDTAGRIDDDIKDALIELKQKIYHAEELEYAVRDYALAIEYLRENPDETYAIDRIYEADLRLQAILKYYERIK